MLKSLVSWRSTHLQKSVQISYIFLCMAALLALQPRQVQNKYIGGEYCDNIVSKLLAEFVMQPPLGSLPTISVLRWPPCEEQQLFWPGVTNG